jgi:hypothetical protein
LRRRFWSLLKFHRFANDLNCYELARTLTADANSKHHAAKTNRAATAAAAAAPPSANRRSPPRAKNTPRHITLHSTTPPAPDRPSTTAPTPYLRRAEL